MNITPLLLAWLATIIGSLAIKVYSTIEFIKHLAKNNYKCNLDKILENSKRIHLFVPIINMFMALAYSRQIYKDIDKNIKMGIIIPITNKEKKQIENDPSLQTIMEITRKINNPENEMIMYIDENEQENTIEFKIQNGWTVIERVRGPEIENKTKIEQRAILLQKLEKLKQYKYEIFKRKIEEQIEQGKGAIVFSQIYPEDLETIAKLIIEYGNDIKIYVQFYNEISPEEEKRMLETLSKILKEFNILEMQFIENEKTLKRK